ncbi:MAG: hypothetical protein ABWZ67_10185 [Solirubrobacteraceae bacterium]
MRRTIWIAAAGAAVALTGVAPARADACAADAKGGYARVELYRELNCVRPSVSAGFAGSGDRPDFAAFTNYEGIVYDVDDSRSSLAVAAGNCVRLFDGRGYTGADSGLLCAPAIATGFFADLGAMNDRASSMRVCPASMPSGCDRPAAPPPPPPPVPNGSPASPNARLSAAFARSGRVRRTLPFGRRALVRVAVTDELARPIAAARLQVRTREIRFGAEWLLVPDVTTGADGRALVLLERGPSRRVLVEYRAHAGDEQSAAADTVRLAVRAGVTLRVRPRQLRGGRAIRMRGRLRAAPATGLGKLVTLQARERGRWRDFKTARTRHGGRFSARYRFSSGARGTFPIRAVARADASYPYATGRSRTVRVHVG